MSDERERAAAEQMPPGDPPTRVDDGIGVPRSIFPKESEIASRWSWGHEWQEYIRRQHYRVTKHYRVQP